jgi:hypothetical protein
MIYAIVPFSRPKFLYNVVNNFKHQTLHKKKLIIVENGDAIGCCKKNNFEPDILLTSEKHQSLAKNEALNWIKNHGGGLWATFDDDDYYGPEYLSELDQNSKKACVFGKGSVFVKTTDEDILLLDTGEENKISKFTYAGTIAAYSEVSPFFKIMDYSEDTQFLYDIKHSVYSSSRFNYVYQRWVDNKHTYPGNDDELLSILAFDDKVKVKKYGKINYSYVDKLCSEPKWTNLAPKEIQSDYLDHSRNDIPLSKMTVDQMFELFEQK